MPSLVEIGSVVLEEKIFKFHQCIFAICVIISTWQRVGSFIWTNLNPLHPRMLCAKFGWNWPSGSGEEDENVKSLRQRRRRRRTTDKFWSEKLTWAFGSGELKREGWLNQQCVKINSHEKQNSASIMRLTLKYNDLVKHYGTQRTLRRRTTPMYFVFDANNWLSKYLAYFFPIYKHSL